MRVRAVVVVVGKRALGNVSVTTALLNRAQAELLWWRPLRLRCGARHRQPLHPVRFVVAFALRCGDRAG